MRRFGQELGKRAHQFRRVLAALGADRHHVGKRIDLGHLRQERQHLALVVEQVDLVDDEHNLGAFRHEIQHLFVARPETFRFDHQRNDIDIHECLRDGAVHVAVERIAMLGLEAGRIDEYELVIAFGEHARHAMARGLWLARNDADLLPDQAVQQGRLADIRTTDDGDITGACRTCWLRSHGLYDIDGGIGHVRG